MTTDADTLAALERPELINALEGGISLRTLRTALLVGAWTPIAAGLGFAAAGWIRDHQRDRARAQLRIDGWQ